MNMNPRVKAAWVAKLREPDRKQTIGVLEDNQGQCCLGVLCELAVEAGIISAPSQVQEEDPETGREWRMEYGDEGWNEAAVLPKEVRKWAGLTSANPRVDYNYEDDTLPHKRVRQSLPISWVNDHKEDFNGIADIIEAQL